MSREQMSPIVTVPDHLDTVTRRLAAGDGARAIDFFREAFGAEQVVDGFALIATPSPVIDQFYGDRARRLRDRQRWMMNQRIEDVSADRWLTGPQRLSVARIDAGHRGWL
jgi:hypothetical protein